METTETRLAREGTAAQQLWFAEMLRAARDGAWECLGDVRTELWARYSRNELTDGQAAYLDQILYGRLRHKQEAAATKPARPRESYVGSRPRTDASLVRRRQNIAIGLLPDKFLSGRRWGIFATLAVIARAYLSKGRCELYVEAIAAEAGYCASTVREALGVARRQGWISVEHRRREGALRNDANLVTITDPDWLAWLKARAPTWRSMTRRAAAFWGVLAKAGSSFAPATRTRDNYGVAHPRDNIAKGPATPARRAARVASAKPVPS